jgi:xylose isomerase
MEDWLKVAVCYWHSFNWPGADIFGGGTLQRPWLGATVTQAMADAKLDAAFDFFARLGVRYFCFHDVDAMATAASLKEHDQNLRKIEAGIAAKMAATGIKLLWGTANLFSHPRYAGGAATSPDPEVYAWAAAQVRCCLEATHRLGGENYVLWGGREGYDSLLNTDLKSGARSLWPVSLHGGGAQAPHRLQGHDSHRTQTLRAHQASVRSRRGCGIRLPAALRTDQGGQGQYRSQSRHARGIGFRT